MVKQNISWRLKALWLDIKFSRKRKRIGKHTNKILVVLGLIVLVLLTLAAVWAEKVSSLTKSELVAYKTKAEQQIDNRIKQEFIKCDNDFYYLGVTESSTYLFKMTNLTIKEWEAENSRGMVQINDSTYKVQYLNYKYQYDSIKIGTVTDSVITWTHELDNNDFQKEIEQKKQEARELAGKNHLRITELIREMNQLPLHNRYFKVSRKPLEKKDSLLLPYISFDRDYFARELLKEDNMFFSIRGLNCEQIKGYQTR